MKKDYSSDDVISDLADNVEINKVMSQKVLEGSVKRFHTQDVWEGWAGSHVGLVALA